jgi:hypothetical protein
MQNVQERKRH